MKYLLDSNIVINMAVGTGAALRARVAECEEGDLAVSAIVLAEIAHGSLRDKPPAMTELRALLEEVSVLPFDQNAGFAYARLPFKRASYDRLIAAHALSLDLTVVTDNVAHFADVPGLAVEDWTLPLS